MNFGNTTMTRTAKIQILPDEMQKRQLLETMQAYARACDYVSKYVFDKKELRRIHLHHIIYPKLREKATFGLRSQMAESVMKTVVSRYRTTIRMEKKWRLISFRHPEYDLVWNRDYSFREEQISLNTLKGRVKMSYVRKGMEEYFDGTWHFGTGKLVTKHGKWFLHIPMSQEREPCKPEDVNCVVGCDLGVNFILTAYDSDGKTKFFSGKQVKQRRAAYEEIVASLKKRKTPSARRRLKAIMLRENGWMQDVNHQVSKALVTAYPKGTLFVLEEQNRGQRITEHVVTGGKDMRPKQVDVSWSFMDIRQKLAYKAMESGSEVLGVNPAYSSQICPKCGNISKNSRKKRTHTYQCNQCGYTTNDDRIGAMNLYEKGMKYLHTVGLEHALGQGAQSAVSRCDVLNSPEDGTMETKEVADANLEVVGQSQLPEEAVERQPKGRS